MSNVKINLTHEQICQILVKHLQNNYKLEVPSKYIDRTFVHADSFDFSIVIEGNVYSNLKDLSVEVTAKI